jgi:hypothetical protein
MCLKCSAQAMNNTPVCSAHGAFTDYHKCVTYHCGNMIEESELSEYCDICNDINNGKES